MYPLITRLPFHFRYFYPPAPITVNSTAAITAAAVALNISGVSHVTFSGIEVRESQGIGILATGVTAVIVDNVTSANHGTNGIQVGRR